MPGDGRPGDPGGELERLRLENETLSAVVGVVTSGPDLAHILDRVVDLLTRATDCHACFVYLRHGERLQLRAASPVFSHLVGRVGFGVDEGLAGWVARRGEPAFILEGALEDPRTHYVPELEEERFQSMVAVPIPRRAGESLGAIVLHTAAPREFDERIINVLSRAAALVAGAIENARLYEDAQGRVTALTKLSLLGREVAAVTDRSSLFDLAAGGIRDLVDAGCCVLYEADDTSGELRRVAASPEVKTAQGEGESGLVSELLELRQGPVPAVREEIAAHLGLDEAPIAIDAVSLKAEEGRTGALLVLSPEPWKASAPELLRAAAQQVALAIQKIDLIERLTEENLTRDLFDALVEGRLDVAAAKARSAGLDLTRLHIVLEARPREGGSSQPWTEHGEAVERAIKAKMPQAFCYLTTISLRAIAPIPSAAVAIQELSRVVIESDVAIGVSESRGGVEGITQALAEATDATRIAVLIDAAESAVAYRDTGAYRYLIEALDSGGPRDHLRDAVEKLIAYDRARSTQLLVTLDNYLSQGRNVAATSRSLFIHVNTLRQRIERIEEITALTLAEEELLALQLAVKLGLARSR